MKYLGVAKNENGRLQMPDGFAEAAPGAAFEAIEIGGDILLTQRALEPQRLAHIAELAQQSIDEHRRTLEGLAH